MSIFHENLIMLKQEVSNKSECLEKMIDLIYSAGMIEDKDLFRKAVLEREEIMSTGIGRGLAIPHGRSATVKHLSCTLFTLQNPIDYESIDDEPVSIIFMLTIPIDSPNEYMKILGQISKFMRDEVQRNDLLSVILNREAFNMVKGIEDEI